MVAMRTAAAAALVDRAVPEEPASAAEQAVARWLRTRREELVCPPLVRVVGAAGSGAPVLARALEVEGGRRAECVDVDGPLPRRAPDVEVFVCCTAPCAHELAWLERPRRHSAVLVATGSRRWPDGRPPGWAQAMPALGGPPMDAEQLCSGAAFQQLEALVMEAEQAAAAARIAATVMRLDRDCDALGCRELVEPLAVGLIRLLEVPSQ